MTFELQTKPRGLDAVVAGLGLPYVYFSNIFESRSYAHLFLREEGIKVKLPLKELFSSGRPK